MTDSITPELLGLQGESVLVGYLNGARDTIRNAPLSEKLLAAYADSVDKATEGTAEDIARRKEVRRFLRMDKYGLNDVQLKDWSATRMIKLKALQDRAMEMDQNEEQKQGDAAAATPEDEVQAEPSSTYITPKILGISHQSKAGRFINATMYGPKGNQQATNTADLPSYQLIVERYKDSINNAYKGSAEEIEGRRLVRQYLQSNDFGLKPGRVDALPSDIKNSLLVFQRLASAIKDEDIVPEKDEEEEEEQEVGVMTEKEMQADTDEKYPDRTTWTAAKVNALEPYQYARMSPSMRDAMVSYLVTVSSKQRFNQQKPPWIEVLKDQLKSKDNTTFEISNIPFTEWYPWYNEESIELIKTDFVDKYDDSLYNKLSDAKNTVVRALGEEAKKAVAKEWYHHPDRLLAREELVNMKYKAFESLDLEDKLNVANSIIALGKDEAKKSYWKDKIKNHTGSTRYPLPSIIAWIFAEGSILASWIETSGIDDKIRTEETKWFNSLYTDTIEDKTTKGGGGITGYVSSLFSGKQQASVTPSVAFIAPSLLPDQEEEESSGLLMVEDKAKERIRNKTKPIKAPEPSDRMTRSKTQEAANAEKVLLPAAKVTIVEEEKEAPSSSSYFDTARSLAKGAMNIAGSTLNAAGTAYTYMNTPTEKKEKRTIRKANGTGVMDDLICLSGMMGLVHAS